jgi:hypothetical protein
MATPGLPLPLRNALATLAITALDEPEAAAALAWLTHRSTAPSAGAAERLAALHLIEPGGRALLTVHAPHTAATAEHAARALRAAASHERPPGSDALVRAVHAAVALWNERLFFEVHEVLEGPWKTARDQVRQALQGVIQVAVAYHHLAHGNLRGARTLMTEGRGRLAAVIDGILPALDLETLLAVTAPWEQALAARVLPDLEPPRLPTRPTRA